MTKIYNISSLRQRRQELRKNQTLQENILWHQLRKDQLGVRFRRQFGVGGYILDFYCPKNKLAIEVDGGVHNSVKAREYDSVRDKFVRGANIRVLRFTNHQVQTSLEFVLNTIKRALQVESLPLAKREVAEGRRE